MKNPHTRLNVPGGVRVRRLRPALVLAIVTLCLVECARREPDIDAVSVRRVITTLSADEMLGRAPFTPAIDKAADFIRGEFASIGLAKVAGMDDYLQRFVVYHLQVQSRRVVLNGVEIPSERSFVWAAAPSVRWTTGDPVEVVVIGPEEDVKRKIVSIDMSDRNTLVLMSTRHEALFRGLAAESSGTYRYMFFLDPPAGATKVWVLTDEAPTPSYDVEVMASVEQLPLTNVVGKIPGRRDDEIVLFSGHYDCMGILDPVDGDSIANGANDGASGTTAMIELARYFKAKGEPERTLIFVAFTGHEIGFQGSDYLARQLDPTEVVAVFTIGAIGKVHPRFGPNAAHISGFDWSDFGQILQHAAEGTPYSFYPSPFEGGFSFTRSDHGPFARRGVPAHSIGSLDPRDKDRHRVSDEVETLDLVNMTNLIRAIAVGATPIVSGKATPTRIKLPLRPN